MGLEKRLGAFEHAQKAQIHIHPAHAQNRIRTFAHHWRIWQCLTILLADSEGPDQTARMRRLIRAIAMLEDTFWHGAALIFELSHLGLRCVQKTLLFSYKLLFFFTF